MGVRGDVRVATPQLLKVTPDDLTHSQTPHITTSQQAERNTVRRRENGLRGQKPSQIILNGKYAVNLSHTHVQNLKQLHTHFLPAEVIPNPS